jgi:glycosyltransferase involved in cell wall biosynthesis
VYNAAPWLEATLCSARAQTGARVEVIVVDDGSTDASVEIARRHEGPSVKLVCSPNRGSSAARNLGLAAAQGEYLQYLDADDLLSPNKVAAQLALLRGLPATVVSTCPIVYFDDGREPEAGVTDANLPFAGDCDDPGEFLLRLYGETAPGGMVQTSQWLTPRAVSDRAGPWDEAISVDNDGEYFARVVLAATAVRYASAGRVYYRKHPGQGSLSGAWSSSEAKVRSGIRATDAKVGLLQGRFPAARVAAALTKSYLEWAWMAYPRFPGASAEALAKARALAGRPVVPILGARSRLLQRLVGWKGARRAQVWWHR